MANLVLAYPTLSSMDFELIQDYRKGNDKLFYEVVEPHFTVVYPVPELSDADFIAEVKEKSKGIKKFDFVIRCSTINKDVLSEYYHTFLVPDEGFSQFVKLHDHLYSGVFKEYLRLDINYIPHIGIGNSTDKLECKKLADECNGKNFTIKGSISQLTVLKYENSMINKLEQIDLY